MKITLLDPAGAGQGARERGAAGDAHQVRWRAELERAQWQSRLRYRPQLGDGQRVSELSAARASADPAPAQRGPAPASAVALPALRQIATRAAAVVPQTRQTIAMFARPNGVVVSDAAMSVMPGAPRPQALALRAQAAQNAATPLPFEHFQWPATASHVSLQGNRLYVALRDPCIDERDWQALHDRVQAQCIAWGLELGELTINGRRVEPVGLARD